eukprot:jgi/Tetstr1/456498/TSEL_043221.t1
MPTSTDGISRRQAAEAAQTQVGAPIQWALDNPDFFLPYVRDTAVRTSPRIPMSARDAIGAAIRPIWDIAHSARGAMREAACHLAILFPAAVLWSHAAGANAHVVRTAIDHRLALWRQGDIPALLHEAALARETIQPTASGPATSRGYLRGRISWRVGKAVRLIRVGRFRDAAALAENHGVAEPSAENIDELRRLFPPPAADDPSGLLPPPEPDDIPPITISPDDLHGVLQRAPADSACHRDGWRVDHLRDLSDDYDTLQSMARFMTVVCSGNVSDRVKQLLSSSTLIPLWKKDEEARGDLRGQAEAQNSPYRPPIRPIGFSSALTRVASSAAMWTIRDHIARAVGPSQFALSTPAGTDMIQWVIQVAMEMDDRLAASSIDASNAYGMTDRRAIRRRLVADPALHSLLPLFDMLYAGPSENWLYDHESDGDAPTVVLTQLRGIRQGCPLATFFFCLTVGPVFDAITAKLGMGGLGLAFADDLHLLGTALGTALALHSAQPALAAVGLSISWGPDKTEVAFAPAEHGAAIREWEGLLPRAAGAPSPPPCPPSGSLDAAAFSRARDPAVLPHLVTGFRRCLGVPRHRKLDPTFVRDALRRPAARQDAILLMAREIADAGHIHASLRLVQVCGVKRFAHLLRGLPPESLAEFMLERDAAVHSTLAHIMDLTGDETAANLSLMRTGLSTMLGGIAVDSLVHESHEQHLGAFFALAGPLAERLRKMPGLLAPRLIQQLANPETSSLPWAAALRRAWQASQDREDSFQPWETDMAPTVAPVGNPVDRAGDTTTGTLDLPPRLTLGELPSLNSAIDEAKGLRKVASVLSHTRKWRVFFDMYKTATLPERIRLLSQSGHGSVTYLTSDTPAAYAVEPEPYRVALRKCCGIAALGDSPLGLEDSCPHCDLSPGATDEALERHIVRCPRAGAWHKVHARIATTMVSILQEAGAPRDSALTEVRGLRSADATRPGDVVQLDYMGPGVHLVLDAAVTGVFRNSIAAQVAVQPGYAARLREQTKFRVDACSSQPVARRHRFVPCVVEEGGRLGEHLLALLKELAERGIASGHLKQPPSWRQRFARQPTGSGGAAERPDLLELAQSGRVGAKSASAEDDYLAVPELLQRAESGYEAVRPVSRVPGLFPLSTDLTNEYLKQDDRRLPAQEEYLWMSCFGAHMAALFVALDELLPYVPSSNHDFTPYLARARNHAEAIDKAFRFRLAFLRKLNEIKRVHAPRRPLLLEWRLQLQVAGVGEDVAADVDVAAKDAFGSDELGQRTLDLLSSSLSAQTLKSYAGRLSQFAEFCHDSENISPLEATTATVVRYVAWIGERGHIAAKSLQPYLSAINTFFELHNLVPIAKDSLHLTSARRGLMLRQRRLDAAPLRVPLPADVAYRFVSKAELIVSAPYPESHLDYRALLASVVNFLFFARGLTGVSCRAQDVHVDTYNITLQIYREKGRAGRRGPDDLRVLLLPVSEHPRVARLLRYFIDNVQSVPLVTVGLAASNFWAVNVAEQSKPWTAATMSDWLSTAVNLVNAAPPAGTSWTSHSLRKGAASAANAIGAPLSHIRYQGGWATNSDVVLNYIDPNVLPSPGAWFFFGHIAPLRHFQVQQDSAAVAFPVPPS